ncbi:uncharacterized protein DMAD_06281 [Drosophila madeirensis]|uniref:F-box domain-containing protein n=1 Tax=Drosophila madeirensis TaxID=30013 RepID=A0AAU9FQW4_DROMD
MATAAAAAHRSILDLPYEVLDLIYKELKYLRDRINLARADAYLGGAFAFHSRDEFKNVSVFDQYISMDSWPMLLSLCGTTVREYSCCNSHNWSDALTKLVEQHCPKLEIVNVNVNARNCNSVRSVIVNARTTIKEIKLDADNRVPKWIPPMMLHEYPEMPLLRKATFIQFTSEELFHIQKFSTLEELELDPGKLYCRPIKLFEITANLKKLRSLKLYQYNIVEPENTEASATSMPFPSLESLKMRRCKISMEMPHCPNITSLDIINCQWSIENVLYRFILKQGETLVNLSIDCRPSMLDGKQFLDILRCCKRLRLFCVQAQKVKFTRDFVATMVDILHDNGVTPDEPLRLKIYGITKTDWAAKWVSLTGNPNLLSVEYW